MWAFRAALAGCSFHAVYGNGGPVVMWLNLNSKAEVGLAEWSAAQAIIVSAPEDKPWKVRKFPAADPDGNRIRVFYDFSRDA